MPCTEGRGACYDSREPLVPRISSCFVPILDRVILHGFEFSVNAEIVFRVTELLSKVLQLLVGEAGEVFATAVANKKRTEDDIHHLSVLSVERPDLREHLLIDPVEMKDSWPEFAPYEGGCYFQPCYHATEPRCAVRDAVAAGEIDARRHARYAALLDEMKQKWRDRYD